MDKDSIIHKPGSPLWINSSQETLNKKWCWETKQCEPLDAKTGFILGVIVLIFVLIPFFLKKKKD